MFLHKTKGSMFRHVIFYDVIGIQFNSLLEIAISLPIQKTPIDCTTVEDELFVTLYSYQAAHTHRFL